MKTPRLTLANFLHATTTPVTLIHPPGERMPRPDIKHITTVHREGGKLKLLKETGRDIGRSAGDLRPVGDQTWRFGCRATSLTVCVLGGSAPDSGTLDVSCTGINPNNQYGLRLDRIHSGLYRTPMPGYVDIFEALSEIQSGRTQIPLPEPTYLRTLHQRNRKRGQTSLLDYAPAT